MIDFRRADLRSVNWWRRTALLLEEVARGDDAAVTHASYLYHLALVANGNLADDGFKVEQKKAAEAFNDYTAAVMPWAERVRRRRKLDEVRHLKELYKQVCGDPDDPVTVARWRRESEALEAETTSADPTAETLAAVAAALDKPKARPRAVTLD